MDDIQHEKRSQPVDNNSSGEDMGKIEPINDLTIQQFYGSSTTEAYRLKSELVGKCMEEIGMGR